MDRKSSITGVYTTSLGQPKRSATFVNVHLQHCFYTCITKSSLQPWLRDTTSRKDPLNSNREGWRHFGDPPSHLNTLMDQGRKRLQSHRVCQPLWSLNCGGDGRATYQRRQARGDALRDWVAWSDKAASCPSHAYFNHVLRYENGWSCSI